MGAHTVQANQTINEEKKLLKLGKLSNLKSGNVWEISQREGGGHRFRGKIPQLKVGNLVFNVDNQ